MKNKVKNPAIVIFKREFAAYFASPIAYIVTGLFLIITGIMFFTAFYLQNRASMRNLFQMLPLILSFFIPALTMRVYAEEKRVGSIETLYTLPVTECCRRKIPCIFCGFCNNDCSNSALSYRNVAFWNSRRRSGNRRLYRRFVFVRGF